jgi:hypothetical protein
MFLIAGIVIGSINAGYWVRKIRNTIIEEDDDE